MTKRKVRVGILISGRGSNMEKLIDACSVADFPAQIVVVGTNNPNASGLEYAKNKSIPTFIVDHKKFSNAKNFALNFNQQQNRDAIDSRQEFDLALHQELLKYDIELLCLAGFMRILGANFIDKFSNRIINIHPSLLPNFKGSKAVQDAIDAKAKISGCTTHFVVPEIDSGPIIMQSEVNIDPQENYDSLAKKILAKEHLIYPLTLEKIAQKILNNEL